MASTIPSSDLFMLWVSSLFLPHADWLHLQDDGSWYLYTTTLRSLQVRWMFLVFVASGEQQLQVPMCFPPWFVPLMYVSDGQSPAHSFKSTRTFLFSHTLPFLIIFMKCLLCSGTANMFLGEHSVLLVGWQWGLHFWQQPSVLGSGSRHSFSHGVGGQIPYLGYFFTVNAILPSSVCDFWHLVLELIVQLPTPFHQQYT